MREISSDEPQKILSIIATLNDNTRLEILSLLMQNREGMTAADISRRIDKKIPSTIYQLEIIQASGLIYSDMRRVESIGREIKHWILSEENFHFNFKVDLSILINESSLSITIRDLYVALLHKRKPTISLNDIEIFNADILKEIILPTGAKLEDKEITKIVQLRAPKLLIDTFIYRIRNILANSNIGEGIHKNIFKEMIGVSDDLINQIVLSLDTYYDIGYDYGSQMIFRKN